MKKLEILSIEIHEKYVKIVLGDTKKVEMSCPRSRMNRLNYVTVSHILVRPGWMGPLFLW